MASLFSRLDEEEAVVRGELDALREKLALAEERLARLVITRETALQLLGASDGEDNQAPVLEPRRGSPPAAPDAVAGQEASFQQRLAELDAKLAALEPLFSTPPAAVAHRPAEWAEALEKILSLLATSGRAMRAREIAEATGEDVSRPARVETTRGRCKRLVKEGKVVEVEPGLFRIAPAPVQAPAPALAPVPAPVPLMVAAVNAEAPLAG